MKTQWVWETWGVLFYFKFFFSVIQKCRWLCWKVVCCSKLPEKRDKKLFYIYVNVSLRLLSDLFYFGLLLTS